MDFSNWGTMLPWMINRTSSGHYGSGNLAGSFITFHNYVEFKKMAARLMSSEPDWQYNRVAKRLVLIPEPRRHHMQDCTPPYHSEINPHGHLTHPDFRNGIPMILEVECEPPVWELYQEEHVKRLTLAYAKIILGNVRGKYDGITLPGGGSITKDIGAEGKEELNQIMENLRKECAGMPEVYFA